MKQTVFNIIEKAPDGYRPAQYFNYFMVCLIILNVTVVILETVRGIHAIFLLEFFIIDLVSVIIFTIEYILRLWVCTLYEEFSHPITGRLRFAFTPYMVIDGLAILPFYIPFIIPIDLRFLRILRLFRILRILKLGRYSDAVNTFHRIVTRKKEQLLLALSLLLIVMVLASALMYDAEHEVQPEVFASIPHAMWWALVTLATVGYGDVYPITPLGKLLSGVVVIVGIMIFALPTAIFAAGFVEEIEQEQEVYCPHCGRKVDRETPLQPKDPSKDQDKPEK